MVKLKTRVVIRLTPFFLTCQHRTISWKSKWPPSYHQPNSEDRVALHLRGCADASIVDLPESTCHPNHVNIRICNHVYMCRSSEIMSASYISCPVSAGAFKTYSSIYLHLKSGRDTKRVGRTGPYRN